jgi:hypothetical protein
MTGQETLVPRSIAGFNSYIRKTNACLISGSPISAIRFNWTNLELITWQDFLVEWMPLFEQYNQKSEEYTNLVKEQLLAIIETCIALCNTNKLLKNIEAASTLSVEDLIIFNLPANNTKVTS